MNITWDAEKYTSDFSFVHRYGNDVARKNYPAIEFIQGDAADFVLPKPVDVVFSNAVFHWIEKEKQPDMI